MVTMTPISEAKVHLSALVASLADRHERVVVLKHGRPAAVMLSADAYNDLIERLDDAEDSLSIVEREHDTIPFDRVLRELAADSSQTS